MGTITKVRVFWVARKNPYLAQATPKNTCHIFTTPKNPGIKNFKPQKILWSSLSLEIWIPPPLPPHLYQYQGFGLKMVWTLQTLPIGYGFRGNYGSVWTYLSFQFQITIRKKEKYANSKWILTNLFCCSSNLSKDYFISYRAGLKRVWITIFFGLKEVRIWRTGWHTPTKNSQDNPPGLFLHKKSSYAWHTVVMQSLCHMLV